MDTQAQSTPAFVALQLRKAYQFRSKTDGQMRYAYYVIGQEASLQAYVAHQENIVIDDNTGNPMHYSRQILGDVATLTPNEDGTRWYAEPNPGIALMKETMSDMLRASGMMSMFGFGGSNASTQLSPNALRDNPAGFEQEQTTPAPTPASKTTQVPNQF